MRNPMKVSQAFNIFNGKCFHCNVDCVIPNKFTSKGFPTMATRDHLQAKALGGKLIKGNIVLSCYGCNQSWSLVEDAARKAADLLRHYFEYGEIKDANS